MSKSNRSILISSLFAYMNKRGCNITTYNCEPDGIMCRYRKQGSSESRILLWNPLKNIEQCLLLAIELNINIQFNTDLDEQTTTAVLPSPEQPDSGEGWTFTESWNQNKVEATCLSIVTAAAVICDVKVLRHG